MSDVHITISFGGKDPEVGLRAFMAWYLDGGGDQGFAESLEYHDLKMYNCEWTDDTIHFEIEEEEFDDEEDEDI